MALINCKKCGRKITDTIKKCPHCGCVNEKYRNLKMEIIKKKKGIIIASLLTIICVIVFLFAGGSGMVEFVHKSEEQANMMTEDEKIAADAVKGLQMSLPENEKMNINELWYRKMDSSTNQVLISYFIQEYEIDKKVIIGLFENGKLISNDVKADKSITKYTAKKESEEISKAKEVRELWNTKGDAYELFVKLDKDKILKNLEIINK